MMSDALLIGALLLGVLGLVSARVGPERLPRIVPGVSWLGLLAGMGLIAAGQITDLRGAVGTALFAGLAVVSGGRSTFGRDAVGGAAAVVVAGAGAAYFAAPATNVTTTGHLVLVAGMFAATAALLAGLVAAAACRTSADASALGLVAAGAGAGASVVGFLRSSLPQSGYSVPLRSETGEAVYWSLPGVEGLPDGLRLSAVLDIPAMPWIVGVGIGLGIVAAVVGLLRMRKAELIVWALVGATAIGALGVLHVASAEARLPGTQRFEDVTRQALRDAKANEGLLKRASFTGEGAVVIAEKDMAPEFFGFGLMLLLALLALTRRMAPFARESDEEQGELAQLAARDHIVRAAGFGWLVMLAAGLLHTGYLGVPWMASASEWAAMGTLFIVTGAAISLFDRRRGRVAEIARAVAPGIAAALFLLVLGLSYAFGTPFALSINAF